MLRAVREQAHKFIERPAPARLIRLTAVGPAVVGLDDTTRAGVFGVKGKSGELGYESPLKR